MRPTVDAAARPTRWLLRRPSADAAARLFCFPYAGCGASMYADWPSRIGPAEVCLLQPPGRENRIAERHYGDYESLADELAEQLLPYLDRPFAFFGHCSGALPGYATAVKLLEAGLPTPSCLFASSQVAPQDGPFSRFLAMDDAELQVELATLVTVLGGVPDPDLIELGAMVLRADVEAARRYAPAQAVQLPGRVTVIGWQDDPEVELDQLAGWSAVAMPGQLRRVVLAGGHYDFLTAPPALLDLLAADLAAVAG